MHQLKMPALENFFGKLSVCDSFKNVRDNRRTCESRCAGPPQKHRREHSFKFCGSDQMQVANEDCEKLSHSGVRAVAGIHSLSGEPLHQQM